jgi:phage repressor protein C with HTH and peptisase S24 domain
MGVSRSLSRDLDHEFVDRIRQIADKFGSVRSLAAQSGMSETAIRNYLSGGDPTRRALMLLSATSGVDPCWLAFGIGSPDAAAKHSVAEEDPSKIEILDALAQSGTDMLKPTAKASKLLDDSVKDRFLAVKFGKARTVVIRVRGNSMEPTIRSGCSVLVDPDDKVVLSGGRIYAIKLNGRIEIRRVALLRKERIKIWSDNPDFEPMRLTTQEAEKDLEIAGHVWGHITEHV